MAACDRRRSSSSVRDGERWGEIGGVAASEMSGKSGQSDAQLYQGYEGEGITFARGECLRIKRLLLLVVA